MVAADGLPPTREYLRRILQTHNLYHRKAWNWKRGARGYRTMPRNERYELVKALNWDYQVNPEDLLAVVEGKLPKAGPFNAERLLIRSLERLTWYAVLNLWGLERLREV